MARDRWIRVGGDLCIYCGAVANSVDHYPPFSMATSGVLLPACQWCNSAIGTCRPFELLERAELVKQAITRKHRRILEMPVWSQHDLKSVEPSLKRNIIAWQEKRRLVQTRLAWNVEAYLSAIEAQTSIALLNARTHTSHNSVEEAFFLPGSISKRK